MELSRVKTERRRMTMVSLEALQSLSSGETRLSVASSGGCAKRQCVGKKSTRFDVQVAEQTETVLEIKETKETARLSLRRGSARLRPKEAEPCKSFHERDEAKETIKRRRVSSRQQSATFDFQEPEVTETLSADDARSLVSDGSEAVEPSESRRDTKDTNGTCRVTTRRQSAKGKSQTATETNGAIKDVVTDPSISINTVQECDVLPSTVSPEDHEKESKNKPEAEETGGMMRRTSMRRTSRHAAEKKMIVVQKLTSCFCISKSKFIFDFLFYLKRLPIKLRQCVGKKSTRFDVQVAEQTETVLEMDDVKEIKETARLSLRRGSARLRPKEAEPCKSFHERDEVKETVKRKRVSSRQQSARFDFKEPEVTETLSADDARSLVSDGSEAVETSESRHDTKDRNGTRRVTTRRQSAKGKSKTATDTDGAIKDVVTDPSININTVQECDVLPSTVSPEDHEKESKNKPEAEETGGMMRRTSMRRTSRHAAEKVQSYREVSLKVKLRRDC
ncbi:hypothetical protein DY000_02019805 [Brassica cretica]|uniref:Shugoshin C-terminal domain-containing protein n=1 Tax=Brassica cretica TaxID=69181 RepID=A0ABQ7DBR4_BRACR|nr:hypothetical protein DY000_02019805 [Brassica cretica]